MSLIDGSGGKLKTLLDRLTAARAAYLDAAITSRAAAATALDNTVWTSTKAGYLDQAISDVKPPPGGYRPGITSLLGC